MALAGGRPPRPRRCSEITGFTTARQNRQTDKLFEEPRVEICTMAKLVYGLNQSLDGYVDHLEFRPSPALFRHFIEHVRDLTGIVYGRRTYEVMRDWDEDLPDWVAEEHDYAAAWRSQPKWVVSRSLKSVGPNATLVEDDVEAVIRGLKAQPV